MQQIEHKVSKLFILMFVLVMLSFMEITFASADQIFQANQPVDLKIQCIINGTYCSAVSVCNITVAYPNNTLLISNRLMTNNISFYNYTLPDTSVLGNYKCSVTCCDGGFCGTSYSGDYIDISTGNCDFTLTPTGGDRVNSIGTFTILLIVSLIVLIFGVIMSNEYIGFVGSALMLVTGVYSMIYGLGNLSNFYTQAVSYILLGIGTLFFIAAGYSAIEGAGLFNRAGAQDDVF